MTTLTKLFLLPLISMLMVVVLFHVAFLPIEEGAARARAIQQAKSVINASQSDLVRSMLENDLAAFYSAIEYQVKVHADAWHNIEVFDNEGERLYPLFPYAEPGRYHGTEYVNITHALDVGGTNLGYVHFTLNWSKDREAIRSFLAKIELIVLLVLGVIFVVSIAIQRRLILIPLRRLGGAAKQIAAGNYNIQLSCKRDDEVGELMRDFASMRDDLRVTHDELVRAREDAEEATRFKSRFLANMSHEIRTPMNAIVGMTHLALQTGMTSKQRYYVTKVKQSSEILLNIINDILDISKIEAGKLVLEQTDFRLDDVLDNLAAMISYRVEEKGLELMFDLPLTLPTALVGDPLRLGQILINLGNNAVKFTEHGEVVLSVQVLEDSDTECRLQFSVRDTGVGISAEQQKSLFHSFSQADDSTTRKFGGTGLGLAISKSLVEMMGGDIWVDSTEGGGSIFSFTARFGKQQGQRPVQLPRGEFAKLKVLVVDDSESAREIFDGMLRSANFSVDLAESGAQALDLVKESDAGEPYDVVLIDWKMPELDGLETVKALQANQLLHHQPAIVMITASGSDALKAETADAQIKQFITKPVTASTLLDAIMQALGAESMRVRPAAREDATMEEDVARLQGAHVLLVEDNDINQELAVELLTANGMHVAVANNGAEALGILATESFDGVLMDCQMPVLDGYETTRKLRREQRFTDLPIIAMTANAMAGDREKVLEAGMNDHIAKPINVSEMFRIMARWITPSQQ